MKLALAAFAFACMSFGADATDAVRGKNDAEPDVRKLQADDELMRPDEIEERIAPDGEIGADHYYKRYQTGSCTCAKDAYLSVYKEAQSQLKMVPLVQDDNVTGTEAIFPKIQREINRLLDFAVCFLHSIDCGCDDGRYGYKIINYYRVSTYQCCCDVHAVKDIIINAIQELAKWEMTMDAEHNTVVNTGLVHKRAQYHVLEKIVQNVYKNAREIGGLYIEKYEDCLDAICADDSLFEPTLPIDADTDWDPEYACGNGGPNACQLVCNVNGKTVCGWTDPSGSADLGPPCTSDADCSDLEIDTDPTGFDAWKCIPQGGGDPALCVPVVEGDTACP